jgi:3-methyladenine DNA glycosylase AlkD
MSTGSIMNEIIQHLHTDIAAAEQDKANLTPGNYLITAVLRKIIRQNFQRIKHLSKDEIFNMCETLLHTGDGRDKAAAFQWAFQIRNQYSSDDFPRFERWLSRYVDNWGSCDDFCTHAFGHFIYVFPEHFPAVISWTESENIWFRRGAAVVLIYGIRRGQNLAEAFKIANSLLIDTEDLVQKGYGWMLKEVSKIEPSPVFDYVIQHKDRMPRTSLRYAIEKLPPELRAQAMSK